MEKRSIWLVPGSPLSPQALLDLSFCVADPDVKQNPTLTGVHIDIVRQQAVASNNHHMRVVKLRPANRVNAPAPFTIGVSPDMQVLLANYPDRSILLSEVENERLKAEVIGSEDSAYTPLITNQEYPNYHLVLERVVDPDRYLSCDTNTLSEAFKISDVEADNLAFTTGFYKATEEFRPADGVISPIKSVLPIQAPIQSILRVLGSFEGDVVVGLNENDPSKFIFFWLVDSGIDPDDDLF